MGNVDRNEKIWAYTNTGSRMHAFVQMMQGSENHMRAMCRTTITRNADAKFIGACDAYLICRNCMNKAVAMWERAEASMETAQERHDVGYVTPVPSLSEEEIHKSEAELVGYLSKTPCMLLEERSAAEKAAEPRTWGQELGSVTDPAPELPAGTRVATSTGVLATVQEDNRGWCTSPGHPNEGLPFVSIKTDGGIFRRMYVEELSHLDALHAEAKAMDAEETAKAAGVEVGKLYKPSEHNHTTPSSVTITVTKVWQALRGVGVAYQAGQPYGGEEMTVTSRGARPLDIFTYLFTAV